MTTPATTALAIAEFAGVVYEPEDLVEVRCFRGGEPPKRWWLTANALPELAGELHGINSDGWDVYVGANPRTERGGTDEHVARFRTLFADWDGISLQTVRAIVANAGLPDPTIYVESGHGVHGYWRFEPAITDAETWRCYQRGLIAAVGSDPKIKDPARIMRLPGLMNVKAEPVPCRIAAVADRDEWFDDPAEVGVERLELPPPPADPTVVGEHSEPHPMTVRFVRHGALEGDRNQAAFRAACDLAARGWTEAEALPLIMKGASACGLPLPEAERSLRSAFSKPREPSVHLGDIDTSWAAERMARGTSSDHERAARRAASRPARTAPAAEEEADAPAAPDPSFRPTVVNHVLQEVPHRKRTKDGKVEDESKQVRLHVPLPAIRAAVKAAKGGWPRAMNGILFAYDETVSQGGMACPRGLTFLGRTHELFAWMQETSNLSWVSGQLVDPGNTGGQLSAVTRDELHAGLAQWQDPEHAFAAIELTPQYPPMPGVFYAPCRLPEPDGSALTEFLEHLNPATELDRAKLLALLLTLVCGLPHGKRPAFLLTSKHGRGSGKTATAIACTEVVGGAITMAQGEDPEILRQRFLSDDGLHRRAVLIDNIKQMLHAAVIESMITAPTIQGKRLYHGGASRPNNMTWVLTANTPSVSQDLAQRCVIIEIGAPKRGLDFDAWRLEFMRTKRAALVADLLELLRGPVVCPISPENRDRWGLWQDHVLSRIEGADEVAASIIASRGTVDADREQAEDVAACLDDLVHLVGADPARTRASILRTDVAKVLQWEGLADSRKSARQIKAWLDHLVDVEPLRGRFFEDTHKGDGRRWVWMGREADASTPRFVLGLDRSFEDWTRRTRYRPDADAQTDMAIPI